MLGKKKNIDVIVVTIEGDAEAIRHARLSVRQKIRQELGLDAILTEDVYIEEGAPFQLTVADEKGLFSGGKGRIEQVTTISDEVAAKWGCTISQKEQQMTRDQVGYHVIPMARSDTVRRDHQGYA